MKVSYAKNFKSSLKLFNNEDQVYNTIKINNTSDAIRHFKSYLEACKNSTIKMQYEHVVEFDKSQPCFEDVSHNDLFIAEDIERENNNRFTYVSTTFYFARTEKDISKYKAVIIKNNMDKDSQDIFEVYKYKSCYDISNPSMPILSIPINPDLKRYTDTEIFKYKISQFVSLLS